jgi:hypothetical protein
MMFLRWEQGRQEGSYYKMALLPLWLSKVINTDAYLLKFPDGCSVVKHKDPVSEGYKHFRMNITIKRPDNRRNKMYILGPVHRWWRFEVFRPDAYFHGLEPITGSMLMLSIGCRIKS